jgi:hypothetical protein
MQTLKAICSAGTDKLLGGLSERHQFQEDSRILFDVSRLGDLVKSLVLNH